MPQSTIVKLKKRHDIFLAVQDSSIGDLVTHSVSESVSESCFDFSDFREHCRAVVDN